MTRPIRRPTSRRRAIRLRTAVMGPARVRYDRLAAVRYASRHWNRPNPEFANLDAVGSGGDCTNFISQCLLAGGWPMDYRESRFDAEWWYRRIGRDDFDHNHNDWWSCTWAVAESHVRYIEANYGGLVDLLADPRRARRLRRGDTIVYDWDGDGTFDHQALVTGFQRNGEPLVTYRTRRPLSPVHRRHWRLRFRGRAARIFAVRMPDRPYRFGVEPDFGRLLPCDRSRLWSSLL